ncbi:MAG: hypothetical protein KTR32_23570 [Granulosicoccus sp.]|nr:hypothetical protein [Granulosicoccus sp.]
MTERRSQKKGVNGLRTISHSCRNSLRVLLVISMTFVSMKDSVSNDMIPRSLLIDMIRSQYSAMCVSDSFASCMGFSQDQCIELSESAVTKCLMPLPEMIHPDKLKNRVLEACPQQVFENAGFSEKKAVECFDKAMESKSNGK